MEPFLREHAPLQVVVLAALGGLMLLPVWRPAIGLALSAAAMVLMACRIYYDASLTSNQVTTAAVYMVGGLIAAGLAGYIRLLERPPVAPARGRRAAPPLEAAPPTSPPVARPPAPPASPPAARPTSPPAAGRSGAMGEDDWDWIDGSENGRRGGR